jgi:3-methyladenine DNA glycosylase AlkD
MDYTAREFVKRLKAYAPLEQQQMYEKEFEIEKPSTVTNDIQIEIRMRDIFSLAKEYMNMPFEEVEKLLESPIHKIRVGAVSIMDWKARDKKTTEDQREKLYELYIRRHDRINTWDLVDRSAIYVVGQYLFDKPHEILYKLARSQFPMERRTAIVSTAYFMNHKFLDDTFTIAEILLQEKEELVQKAVGWMLRYAGDQDRERLVNFLDKNASYMPRPMLRSAVEKFSSEQRKHYLHLDKVTS